jgi:hypothetical protein
MADEIKDGGPAFPIERHLPDSSECYYGMSLRDWFAGMALCGISAHPEGPTKSFHGQSTTDAHAYWAYNVADAMLRTRAKK